MAGLKTYDVDPAALDPNGICENQTQLINVSLDLDGALCDLGTALQFDIGDAYGAGVGGVKLLIDSAGAIDTVVFTITGKDQDGVSVTEDVTGVNTTAVSTVKYYSQVTEIATSIAAVDSNVFVGTVTGELCTPTYVLNKYSNTGAGVSISGLSGTCQFDIQETFTDIAGDVSATTAVWAVAVSNGSADTSTNLTVGAAGCRLVLDSYTDGAELQFTVASNPYR
jgi:hypothetical protein